MRSPALLLVGPALLISATFCSGETVTVDADMFPTEGFVLNNAFDGVTLSRELGTVGADVLSRFVTESPFSSWVFAPQSNAGEDTWAEDNLNSSDEDSVFRADFEFPTSLVSIDIIPNDGNDPAFLRAFNLAGDLLEEVVTDGNSGAGMLVTASITRSEQDIAFIRVSGESFQSVYLDRLQFQLVPEPAGVALGVLAFLSFGTFIYRSKRQR